MKRLHKAAAVLFAAAILCSFSVFAYAAEDDWGDEWETEEISASEAQENSHQSAEPETSFACTIDRAVHLAVECEHERDGIFSHGVR